ncbi:hypothetical protein NQT72_04095 [Pseudoalteromonas carrageenovora]|uniref:hypothetical protein n=1 Tax=Pseudoalteromonas carrageenovora TaxID=227 RepID=UPI002117DF79|nr:hypothetical protein [Pseudoalteromonas carrageenovora]MCQ8888704.1 hypothetical protein [Pseudoalteromonas carrageenovora]
MNLDNFKNTWQQQNSVNESAITINQSLLSETKVNKQMKELSNMKWARIIESAAFFFIILLLGQYIAKNFSVSAPVISALILAVYAIVGLAGNIGQIVHISNIDYAKPISQLQKDIYRLCSHKLQLTKLLLMSVPFYMAYVFIGFDVLFEIDLFAHLEQHMVWFYSVSSLLLLIATGCVLAKLNYTNIKAPWVKRTIAFIVGERLVNMAQFINNVESTDN